MLGTAARRSKPHRVDVLGVAVVLVVAWLLAIQLAGDRLNPDGTAYIANAERWLSGDVGAAANGYWGPLLSWLLAPLLALGAEPVGAVKGLLLGVALVQLVVAAVWLRRLAVDRVVAAGCLLATAALLVWQALFGVYPDMLMNLLVLSAALWLLPPTRAAQEGAAHWTARPVGRGVLAGVLLGLGYLAKATGLPLGAGLVVAAVPAAWWLYPQGARAGVGQTAAPVRAQVVRSGVALVALVLVAAPWVVALSVRAGTPTWSTAAGLNARLVGSEGNPMDREGLFELPDAQARSPWDDPAGLTPVDPDGPVVGTARPGEQAASTSALLGNTRVAASSLLRRVALAGVLAAVAVLVSLRRRRPDGGVLLLAVLAAGNLLGYGLLIVIERYLWLPMLVGVVLAAVTLTRIRPRRLRLVALVALVVTTGLGAVAGLRPIIGVHRHAHLAASDPRVAALLAGQQVATTSDWSGSLALCARVDCIYRGQLDEPADPTLDAAGVPLVLDWSTGDGGRALEILDVEGDQVHTELVLDLGDG